MSARPNTEAPRRSSEQGSLLVRTLRALPALGACWVLIGSLPATGVASDEDPKRRISFRVERSRSVENDWSTATLRATREDRSAREVADRINQDMRWALDRAKQRESEVLSVRSGGYVTTPVRDPKSGAITLWRGSQDLILQGSEFAALGDLIGALQERLELVSLDFSVSTERTREIDRELVDELLDAFRARAEQVRERLGAKGYEIVQVQLDSAASAPPMRARLMTADSMVREVAPPALEAGSSEILGNAFCTIELRF